MKKLVTLALISVSLFACSNQAPQMIMPVQDQAAEISSLPHFSDLLDGMTLNKERTLAQITNNTITVKPDTINRDKNALRIYFSNGEIAPGSFWHVVMGIKINDDQFGKRADAGIGVESSYFSGFRLTKAETVEILKGAKNYSKFANQLDKILR